MRRLGLFVSATVAFLLVSVAPALAESVVTRPQGGSSVSAGGGGTAFTGANISLGLVLLGALLVLGIGSLLVSRRRAAASR